MDKKPENIREFIWKIIDTDLALKKDISRQIINVRSLAKYIIDTYKVNLSLDSVISAIRRYPKQQGKKYDRTAVYNLLKQAKIRSITKMASISLKKNEETTQKLGLILPEVDFESGEILRIIEGAKLFKIIIDKKSFEKMYSEFGKKNIIEYNKAIGMVELVYPNTLEKTPGVFASISTELGSNNISIIDALIISNEHIIVVDEKDLLKSFEILYNLCS
jgi:aspartokinase